MSQQVFSFIIGYWWLITFIGRLKKRFLACVYLGAKLSCIKVMQRQTDDPINYKITVKSIVDM